MVAKLATISDCILEDKRWTEFKKYGKISIRDDIVKSELCAQIRASSLAGGMPVW